MDCNEKYVTDFLQKLHKENIKSCKNVIIITDLRSLLLGLIVYMFGVTKQLPMHLWMFSCSENQSV